MERDTRRAAVTTLSKTSSPQRIVQSIGHTIATSDAPSRRASRSA